MLSTIFIIFLMAIFFAWKGNRKQAFYFFGLSFLTGVYTFIHHISTQLNLDL